MAASTQVQCTRDPCNILCTLLQLYSPSKELTPAAGTVPAATKDINDAVAGEETQQVEMIVADVEENEGEKTPDIESDAEREKDQERGECLIQRACVDGIVRFGKVAPLLGNNLFQVQMLECRTCKVS